MSENSELMKLYSARILALAADMPYAARLDAPDATSKKRAPLCGSTVTVDVSLTDGAVSAFGQDVKACALGQASASVIGSAIIGLDAPTIAKGHDQLLKMLKEDGPVPDAPFEGLEVLIPAKDYKNRHASIMLAFDATLDALSQIKIAS